MFPARASNLNPNPSQATPTPPTTDDVLNLLSVWYEAWERGIDRTPESLCPNAPELHSELRDRIDAVKRLEGIDSPPQKAEQPLPNQLGDRYRIFFEIARGGMGIVYAAQDLTLGRAVAVKVMMSDHLSRATIQRRFVEEARITGQLQHPSIPPVHDLGTLPDGRPYLVMKLIKGRTLADLLKERPDPRHDLPRFLQVCEQVAQTVAYAHSKGVIHRDLKPANIMVGTFGEVQVMDWGLAKVLNESAPEAPDGADAYPASVIESDRDPDSHTRAGSVLGTFAYMPPEQAHGDVRQVGRHSDVFALGSLFCEVLTGKPVYTGSGQDMRVQAMLGQIEDAVDRLQQCDGDEDLVRLVRQCLDPDFTRRPPHGGAVSEAMTQIRLTAEQSRLHWEATQKIAEKRKRRALEAEALFTLTFICHLEECGVDPPLAALGRRCLSVDPRLRFRSVKELTEALTQYRATRGYIPREWRS